MFASGKFSVWGFSCCFVWVCICLLGAKGFPLHLPRTREQESALHLGCWPQTTCTPNLSILYALRQEKQPRSLGCYPFPAFKPNLKAWIVRWGTRRSSVSIPVGFMWAEWISALQALINPVCSLCLTLAGHISTLSIFLWLLPVLR